MTRLTETIGQTTIGIVIEKHPDGYVGYPLGPDGVVVGQGNSFEEALADVKSAIKAHIEVFGKEILSVEPPNTKH